jgi:hypothetical protein
VTITLRVHPRYGQGVAVLRTHGPDALWVETPDGKHTIVPAAWTDWRPRAGLPEIGGRQVLLVPDAMKELAAYAAARRDASHSDDGTPPGTTKAEKGDAHDPSDVPASSRGDQRRQQPTGGRRGGHRTPAPVVEQAGASKAHRAGPSGKRGAR